MSAREAQVVRDFLGRVSHRLATIAVAEGSAAGIAVAAVFVVLRWTQPWNTAITVTGVLLAVAAGIVTRVLMTRHQRNNSAAVVERRAPGCHNLVLSAHELMLHPQRASASMSQLVYLQAAAAVRTLQIPALLPFRRSAVLLGGSIALLTAALALQKTTALTPSRTNTVGTAVIPAISEVLATVQPPAYTARPGTSLRDPARIDAIAGSRIRFTIQSNASAVELETLEGKTQLVAAANGVFTGEVSANGDGFIALQPTITGRVGTRKLIGLSVTPDRAPRVRLTAPGKDMMYPDGNRSLTVLAEADDDLALGSLKLRYTKVSGSGERFTFTEGEVPLQVDRSAANTWTARAGWNLAELALEAGDMVVYRAVATDRRPGAPAAESDSYIAEIRMVGSDAAAGFAIDPDQERYALSQQMIIVKTERLLAKRTTLGEEAFATEAADIAVEQRRVRAEFVFMMGGELEDAPPPDADMTTLNEEAEAEGEADILDGRGANIGRVALQRAVRAMSGAVTLLNEINVAEALVRERSALKELERAFSHTRIILRALSVQERLDLSRRMTGPLLEAGRSVYPVPVAVKGERAVALRGALAGVAELSAEGSTRADASSRAAELAERVLRVDPSSRELQDIASGLSTAASTYGRSRPADARRLLEVAAVSLTRALRADVPTALPTSRSFTSDRLQGALTDALRTIQGGR